jgi:hypothetical protein
MVLGRLPLVELATLSSLKTKIEGWSWTLSMALSLYRSGLGLLQPVGSEFFYHQCCLAEQ